MQLYRFQLRHVTALASIGLALLLTHATDAYLSFLPATTTMRRIPSTSPWNMAAEDSDVASTSPSSSPPSSSTSPSSSSSSASSSASSSSANSGRLRDLPELKGDFDWDEKFAGDADWLTDPDQIPGKMVLNEVELAQQVSALTKLEEQWRKESLIEEDEAARKVGFVENAELLNGRSAMFFLVVGLLTEYWTGFSLPEQVEEMLRVSGLVGP